MEYRRLGKSGLQVSALSFGSWVTFSTQVDDRKAQELMSLAYDSGVNFFDNAEVYAQGESEKIMGRVLQSLGWTRDTYCVSSKVFWGGEKPTQRGLSRKHVTDACHAALKRLQVEYLDLYFCHRPDLHTPIEETVLTMNDLIRQGKVLYWGTSEWTGQQITEAHAVAKAYGLIGPTMEQPQYNLFERDKVEADFQPIYDRFGLGLTTWSPLASGILTGKYNKGIPADSRMNLPGYEWLKNRHESPEGQAKITKTIALEQIAQEMDTSLTRLSVAWCLKNPHVSTVILGATSPSQLKENLGALSVVNRFTPALEERIESIMQNKPAAPTDYLV